MPGMPATTVDLEGRVLSTVEGAEDPVSVDEIRTQITADREELGKAIRSLVSKGCILVTREWGLVTHPGHEQLH